MTPPDPTLTITAEQIDQEAIVDLARALRVGGFAFRPHASANAIEVKSQSHDHPNTWLLAPIKTTDGIYAHYFATTTTRDQTYNALRALQ